MTLTNEDMLAIGQLLDTKLHPLAERTKNIELFLENDILPRLQNIESCYTSTNRKCASSLEDMESLKADMNIVKKVITHHSEKLSKIS